MVFAFGIVSSWGDAVLPGTAALTFVMAAAIPLNPEFPCSFQWIASVAKCFEGYGIPGLLASFKSTSSDYPVGGTTSALPTVQIAFSYNVNAPAPQSKMQILETNWAVDCKTSDGLIAPMECATRQMLSRNLLIRSGAYTRDLALSDQATLYLGGVNTSVNAQTVGELTLIYHIELFKPAQATTDGITDTWVVNNSLAINRSGGATLSPSSGDYVGQLPGNSLYLNPGLPSRDC